MSEPRSKLEEMLASGRAPGILVRGSAWRDPIKAIAPPGSVISDAELAGRQRNAEREFARRAKMAAEVKARNRSGRKSEARLESVGSMPFEAYEAMCKKLGDDANDPSARNAAIKAAGGFFPSAEVDS